MDISGLLQWLLDVDTDVFLAINSFHNTFGDFFMYMYSDKFVWVPMYLSIVYIMFRNFPAKMNVVCLLFAVAIIVITDQTCSNLLRGMVARLRPSNLANPLTKAGLVHIVEGYRGGRFGFPSAHSANSWGLAFFLIFLFRRHLVSWWLVAWAIVTCWSRMYLGVHYPGDILVGMLIGFAGAVASYWVFQRFLHAYALEYRLPVVRRQMYVPMAVGLFTVLVLLVVALYRTSITPQLI